MKTIQGARFSILSSLEKYWLTEFIACLLLMVLVCVFVPFNPSMPVGGLDPSWVLGMNQAVSQGLRIGNDLIFTFGPYASIYTKAYHPATDVMMLAGSAFLAISCCLSLVFLVGRRPGLLITLTLALLFASYSRDALLLFLPFLAALVCYKIADEREVGCSMAPQMVGVFILALAPLGLIPIIKGSALILSVAIIFLCVVMLVARREFKLAILTILVPALVMVFSWVASGQCVNDLYGYFINMTPIASGYTEAMSIPGKSYEVILYIAAAVLIVLAAIFNAKKRSLFVADLFLPGVFSLFLFVSFKAGFVRHDVHAVAAAVAILLAGLSLFTLHRGKFTVVALLFSLVTAGVVFTSHVDLNSTTVSKLFDETLGSAAIGVERRTTDEDWPKADFLKRIEYYKKATDLPVLKGRSDIYSFNQTSLISSGNIWSPRPVFQSYSAYTSDLAEKNSRYLLGENAPDNIFFRVEPIDGRLPSLDDGASWPALLREYHPVANFAEYLRLEKNKVSMHAVNIVQGEATLHQLGETVELPKSDRILVARFDIKPTILGRIANIFYKPAELHVSLELESGQLRTYRVVSGMLKSGVVISPLVENTFDFGLLYGEADFLLSKKVKSIRVYQSRRADSSWKSDYSLQFEELKVTENLGIPSVFGFDSLDSDAKKLPLVSASRCDGSIDVIDGLPLQSKTKINRLLTASGWIASSLSVGAPAEAVYIILKDKAGERTFIKAKATSRADVANAFKKPSLEWAGYSVVFDTEALKGEYSLQLGMKKDGRIEVCPEYMVSAMVNDQVKP